MWRGHGPVREIEDETGQGKPRSEFIIGRGQARNEKYFMKTETR